MRKTPFAVTVKDCKNCKPAAIELQSEIRASAKDCNAVAPLLQSVSAVGGLQYCSNPPLDYVDPDTGEAMVTAWSQSLFRAGTVGGLSQMEYTNGQSPLAIAAERQRAMWMQLPGERDDLDFDTNRLAVAYPYRLSQRGSTTPTAPPTPSARSQQKS